ncbi:DUF6263 family protein [Clostridium sp. JS66]|uniref:DUF6263 family protein n=1 Tax=Clostridium sp. JS66 TaxID=3064705 RepID=UPI00298EC38F|nr:DUF6263 family protein [Clostridium sp. JS66]WPC44157.1 DUF6263 family protein [Clostridium sp. JS66]
MKLKKIIASLSIMTMLFAFVGCSNAMDLSINLKKGDKYNLHELIEQKGNINVQGQNIDLNQVMDMNFAMEVKDVDKDKNVTMDYKYDSIKVSAESDGAKNEYDSKKPDSANPMSALYGSVIGKGFTVKISNKGQVLEVKGTDELLNSIVDKISASAEEKNQIKNSLAQSFGDEAIKSMINQSMNYYPKNQVKNNDTWESKYDIKTMMPMSISNKLKFLGEKDGLLNVDVQSTVDVDTKNKPINFMSIKTNMKLNGNCKGTVNINKETGLVAKADLTENMNGTMEMLSTNASAQNMKMPMKMTAKIIYETTKK